MKNLLKYGAFGLLGIGLIFGKYVGGWIVNVIDNPDTRVNTGKLYVKQCLNNCDTYGTKVNPIPVSRVREDLPDSVSKIRGSEDGWNVDITKNQFKYNVEQYLTYIMPKEEYKERFEKGK